MNTTQPFFEVLRDLRESQGIKLEEISERTKVSPKYFEAIETGDFTVLPNVYMRLFLRSYAIEIGADAEQVLKDYEVATTGKIQERVEINPRMAIKEDVIEENTFLGRMTTPEVGRRILYGLGAIIIFYLVFQLVANLLQEQQLEVTPNTDFHTTPGIAAVDSTDSREPDSSPYGSEPEPNSELPAADINLVDVFTDANYVRSANYRLPVDPPFSCSVRADDVTQIALSTQNSILFQGTLDAGDSRDFSFIDTLRFDLLNAEQITFMINSLDLSPQLSRQDLAVRGSFIQDGSLSLRFYQTP